MGVILPSQAAASILGWSSLAYTAATASTRKLLARQTDVDGHTKKPAEKLFRPQRIQGSTYILSVALDE